MSGGADKQARVKCQKKKKKHSILVKNSIVNPIRGGGGGGVSGKRSRSGRQ